MTPFAEGYTEALRQSLPSESRDAPLANVTLSRIIGDCERFASEVGRLQRWTTTGHDAYGRGFWRDRSAGLYRDVIPPHVFPPLTVSLGDDGLIYLAEAGQ